jgi:hypothetical protein
MLKAGQIMAVRTELAASSKEAPRRVRFMRGLRPVGLASSLLVSFHERWR